MGRSVTGKKKYFNYIERVDPTVVYGRSDFLFNTVNFYEIIIYTGCPRRNVPDFGRVFLMLKYTDITQNTYVKS